MNKYIYVTTLLKQQNDERLPAVIEEFKAISKGKSFEQTAKEHIKELGGS